MPRGFVSGVRPGSLAEEAGIAPGDAILEIAGHAPRDAVDIQFYQADAEVEVRVLKADGTEDLIVFEKEIDEDLGLEFDRPTWDDILLCNNNCFFCFLKGLPGGMRKSLYLKDDDYRLSFLHGNFVTLTNLTDSDWARLEEQRLSPLNVSVHATDPELRRRMLGNPRAPNVLKQLRRLGALGLTAHTQIVLCPGVNDGEQLARSVRELGELSPTVQTISVVPVGASPRLEERSASRDGIELQRPTSGYARNLVRQLRPLQRAFRRRFGQTIVQCSDEYYLAAGEPVPQARQYDGYPQFENGVGMVRVMLQDWRSTRTRLLRHGTAHRWAGKLVTLASGTLIAPTLAAIGREFSELTGATIEVVPVRNGVFGDRVNVSGLVCGQDYIRALSGGRRDCVILPRASLDYFGRQFLDSVSPGEVESSLGAPVGYASRWSDVVEILDRGPARPRRNTASNGASWCEPQELAAVDHASRG